MSGLLKGLTGNLASRKAWVMIIAAALCSGVGVAAQQGKISETMAQWIVGAIGTISTVVVGGTAYEDAAAKGNGKAGV